jgi:O-antigen/teichoic acid export membrane protein
LVNETYISFNLLSIGLLPVILNSAFVGILESYHQFPVVAKVRIITGITTIFAPLLTLQISKSILPATFVLILVKLLALILNYLSVKKISGDLLKPELPSKKNVLQLLDFGGWITITNIVSPLMTNLDRFFIGSISGLKTLVYYVTSYEIVSRIQIIPQSLLNVMFPTMIESLRESKIDFKSNYLLAINLLFYFMLPVCVLINLFGFEILELWLGSDFSLYSYKVLKIFSVGLMINVLSQPAFTVLQALGRPDLTAKAHLIEVVPYFSILFLLTKTYGNIGGATAWSMRMLLD